MYFFFSFFLFYVVKIQILITGLSWSKLPSLPWSSFVACFGLKRRKWKMWNNMYLHFTSRVFSATLIESFFHIDNLTETWFLSFFGWQRPDLITGLSGWWSPNQSLKNHKTVSDRCWIGCKDDPQCVKTVENACGLVCILGLTNPKNQVSLTTKKHSA